MQELKETIKDLTIARDALIQKIKEILYNLEMDDAQSIGPEKYEVSINLSGFKDVPGNHPIAKVTVDKKGLKIVIEWLDGTPPVVNGFDMLTNKELIVLATSLPEAIEKLIGEMRTDASAMRSAIVIELQKVMKKPTEIKFDADSAEMNIYHSTNKAEE